MTQRTNGNTDEHDSIMHFVKEHKNVWSCCAVSRWVSCTIIQRRALCYRCDNPIRTNNHNINRHAFMNITEVKRAMLMRQEAEADGNSLQNYTRNLVMHLELHSRLLKPSVNIWINMHHICFPSCKILTFLYNVPLLTYVFSNWNCQGSTTFSETNTLCIALLTGQSAQMQLGSHGR